MSNKEDLIQKNICPEFYMGKKNKLLSRKNFKHA